MIGVIVIVLAVAPDPATGGEEPEGSGQVTVPAAESGAEGEQPAIIAAPPPSPPPRQPPPAGRVGAAGGQGFLPLPPPPPGQPRSSIARGPWRGRFWLDFQVHVTTPLAGDRPARPTVTSGGGGGVFGWRIRNWVGLYTAIRGQVHDHQQRVVVDQFGDSVRVRDVGRITMFDLLNGRFFVPVRRRFQPYLDLGAGGAVVDSPSVSGLRWGWLGRTAIGFDGWVGRNFTLGASAAYRLLAVGDAIGHSIGVAAAVGIHW